MFQYMLPVKCFTHDVFSCYAVMRVCVGHATFAPTRSFAEECSFGHWSSDSYQGLTARYSFIALISQAPFSAAAADAVN